MSKHAQCEKSKKFPDTQILREITVGDFKAQSLPFCAIFRLKIFHRNFAVFEAK